MDPQKAFSNFLSTQVRPKYLPFKDEQGKPITVHEVFLLPDYDTLENSPIKKSRIHDKYIDVRYNTPKKFLCSGVGCPACIDSDLKSKSKDEAQKKLGRALRAKFKFIAYLYENNTVHAVMMDSFGSNMVTADGWFSGLYDAIDFVIKEHYKNTGALIYDPENFVKIRIEERRNEAGWAKYKVSTIEQCGAIRELKDKWNQYIRPQAYFSKLTVDQIKAIVTGKPIGKISDYSRPRTPPVSSSSSPNLTNVHKEIKEPEIKVEAAKEERIEIPLTVPLAEVETFEENKDPELNALKKYLEDL